MKFLRNLLFIGGIITAIAAGAKLSGEALARLPLIDETEGVATATPGEGTVARGWPDTWPYFAAGMLAAIAGVVLWRMELASARRQRVAELQKSAPQNGQQDVVQLALELVGPAEQLAADAENLAGSEITQKLDAITDQFILPLVNQREDMLHRFGMRAGAEILIAFAYGERLLNRAWSAAADGHLPESRSSLTEALDGFHEVRRLLLAQPGVQALAGTATVQSAPPRS